MYTRGPLLWQGFTILGNAFTNRRLGPRRSAPSQEFNPADRTVINRARILDGISVEASGSYAPLVRLTIVSLSVESKLPDRTVLKWACEAVGMAVEAPHKQLLLRYRPTEAVTLEISANHSAPRQTAICLQCIPLNICLSAMSHALQPSINTKLHDVMHVLARIIEAPDCLRVPGACSFCVQDKAQTLPVNVKADIAGGNLQIFGKTLQLPIKGSGEVTIAYLDDSLRIFCSRTGTAVQLRQDFLQKILS